jgi:glycerol-3-phosphate acyltransferase PlsY
MPSVELFVWTTLAFLAGSIPFSVLIGRLFLRKDIRTVGDANPGAANVWRSGSKALGLVAVLLDAFKAAIPVWLAGSMGGISGLGLGVVAIAPVLGHAFSPFLHFRGGKAIASAFGAWFGLLFWIGPTVLGLGTLAGYLVLGAQAWALVVGHAGLALYLLLTRADAGLWLAWAGIGSILLFKHLPELRTPPSPAKSPLGRRAGKE